MMTSRFEKVKELLFEAGRVSTNNFTHICEVSITYKFKDGAGYVQACEWLMINIDPQIYYKQEHILRTNKCMEVKYAGIKLRLEHDDEQR